MRTPKKSKIILILLPVLLLGTFFIIGHTDWHANRNKHNQLPQGVLTLIEGSLYADEAGLQWELQPHIKNKFHQPDQAGEKPLKPYPNVLAELTFDPENANLKFLSKAAKGGSYEAILTPDGTYLTTGLKQGTYNYSHPGGLWGSLKHVLVDVIPHFANPNYTDE